MVYVIRCHEFTCSSSRQSAMCRVQIALYCFPDWALMRNYVDLSYRCAATHAEPSFIDVGLPP